MSYTLTLPSPRRDGRPPTALATHSETVRLGPHQTERLFDSLMRDYPIQTFLQAFGESPFDVSFKGNEPHVDHIYPQYMLRSKLGCGSREINDIGNLRFVGATDNIRKRAELPASYFARLKASGIPVERHLLVKAFASDPSRLQFDGETYERFRTERRAEIWRLLLAAMGSSASV